MFIICWFSVILNSLEVKEQSSVLVPFISPGSSTIPDKLHQLNANMLIFISLSPYISTSTCLQPSWSTYWSPDTKLPFSVPCLLPDSSFPFNSFLFYNIQSMRHCFPENTNYFSFSFAAFTISLSSPGSYPCMLFFFTNYLLICNKNC